MGSVWIRDMRSREVFISTFCFVCIPSYLYPDGNDAGERGKLGDAGQRGTIAGGRRGSVLVKGLTALSIVTGGKTEH